MRKTVIVLACLIAPFAFATFHWAKRFQSSAPMHATHLRCEYLIDPLGIDETAPRLSWWDESDKRGEVQTAYQILVASTPESLAADKGDLWDTGKVASAESAQIVYSGSPLVSREEAFWKVRVWDKDDKPSDYCHPAKWEMGLLQPSDWQAQWIGMPNAVTTGADPAPYVRTNFAVDKPIVRARVYASAQGLYYLYVNGHRVSKDVFDPGFTQYQKRIQYQTFDVTRLVHEGSNAVGAILGDGWYVGHVGWGPREQFGKQPFGLIQLEVEYRDGTSQVVASSSQWKVSDGPILSSDFMIGEAFDARKDMPGWSTAGFYDGAWQSALAAPIGDVPLEARNDQPVQQWKELHPRTITEPKPGEYVLDLGQNMVGWARLKVSGPAGQTVQMRFAEMLNPDGTIYTANLRKATSTDTYTLRGDGEEIYEPHFTFHGFRYVELTNYPGTPTADSITGIVLGSLTPDTGHFETSNTMVNQLWHNIYWGQRGNYLSIPTDCPQRDERLGWMGDAQIFCKTATYNCDVAAFMTKWTQDVQDGQLANGGFCDVSPRVLMDQPAAPAWGDAGVIVPFTMYQVYNDKRILEKHYDSMKAWVDLIHSTNPNLLWENNRNNDYGDWLNVDADMPRDVLATAYFANSTHLVAEAAAVLGKTEDAKTYDDMYRGICDAFARAFWNDDGKIKGDTQSCYLMALDYHLIPEADRRAAVQALVDNIVSRGTHLSTGFVGVKLLNPVLTRTGHIDLAYKLLLQKTYPSWFYPIENGATTVWERWDGWTKTKGFQDPGMNSFNHYSLGSVGEWLYETVGGIQLDPAHPGYSQFIIRPEPGGDLTWANCSYDSLHGKIVSDWRVADGKLTMDVTVPANTSAEVYVPASSADSVSEGGMQASSAPGVQFLRMENGAAVFQVGSGTYRFSASTAK